MDKYQRNFVTNIKYLRHKSGLSQAEFAEACNVATGTIGNIECGIAKTARQTFTDNNWWRKLVFARTSAPMSYFHNAVFAQQKLQGKL